MSIRNSVLLTAVCLGIATAVACGGSGSPTGPSPSGGGSATIAGTVRSAGASAPAGMNVTVVGTSVSASVDGAGAFELPGVPAGNVELQFKNSSTTATAQVANVASDERIEIEVQLSGSSATILNQTRSSGTGKVALCHRTESGTYQSIEVSVSAEATHRGHGDGKVGEPVPGDASKVFGSDCQPTGASIKIKKSTNGDDANEAPGPTLTVGATVTWTYQVTNDGTLPLSNVKVTDDRVTTVSCPATSLGVGQSMTCTATGIATAGQYRNVGTAMASWTSTSGSSSGTVTGTDVSHYFGQTTTEEEGPKVQLCHRTGNGSYHLIEVSVNAEPAHRAHGDGKIGDAVPGSPGKVFGAGCVVQ